MRRMDEMELVWIAPEFEVEEKRPAWFWASIGIAVLMLAAAIWQQNFLFGVFIVIAEILVIVWGNEQPRDIEFRLTNQHLIVFGRTHYPLGDIEHFSMDEREDEWTDVSVRFHRKLRPLFKFKVPHTHADAVRERFGRHAPHVPWEDSFIDSLQKFLGF